jgi:hypothetical protein
MNSVYLMFYHLGVYKYLLQGSQMFVLVFCNQPNKKHALVEVGIYVFWMVLYVYIHEFDVYNMTFEIWLNYHNIFRKPIKYYVW